jgi:hypothetical protein
VPATEQELAAVRGMLVRHRLLDGDPPPAPAGVEPAQVNSA